MEAENSQEQHRALNLYCNWCAHSRLSRSAIVYDIMRRITEALVRDSQNGTLTIAAPESGVSAALAIGQLQKELISLYRKHRLDTSLFGPAHFRRFMDAVLDQIENAPLELPSARPKNEQHGRMYDAVKRAAGNDPRKTVVRLEVTKDLTPDLLKFYSVPKGTYAWQIQTEAWVFWSSILYSMPLASSYDA